LGKFSAGFHSLLFLAQGLDEYKVKYNLDLTVVSDSVQDVTGDELLGSLKSGRPWSESNSPSGISPI